LAAARSAAPARRSSETRRSWRVPKQRSIRPDERGLAAAIEPIKKLGEGPSDLGRLRRRPTAGPSRSEDPHPIPVDRRREAEGAGHGAQDHEVADGILALAERRGDDGPGRIVDPGDEGEGRTPILEPVVAASVDLDQEAGLGHPVSPAPVARRSAGPGGGDLGGPQETAQRRAADDDPLVLGEDRGSMAVVEAPVRRPGELSDPGPGYRVEPPR
jgi:hypothetical protein